MQGSDVRHRYSPRAASPALRAYWSSHIVVFKDKPSCALISPPVKPKATEVPALNMTPYTATPFLCLNTLADDRKLKASCKGQI